MYPPPVQRLITELGKLPGIGQRTAQRLAFYILRSDAEDANALADAIREVKERIGLCEVASTWPTSRAAASARTSAVTRASSASSRSPATSSPSSARTSTAAATTSSAARCRRSTASIPRTSRSPSSTRACANGAIREVVLATNPTTTGEATALHIAAALRESAPDVAVTRLATGLPVGADLEYADEVTLGKALVGRRAL